jgi:hypothetical protein
MANNVNAIEPTGTVVLRGHTVNVDSDVGVAFVIDCCRHVEDLLTADQLRQVWADRRNSLGRPGHE